MMPTIDNLVILAAMFQVKIDDILIVNIKAFQAKITA